MIYCKIVKCLIMSGICLGLKKVKVGPIYDTEVPNREDVYPRLLA